MLKTKRIKIGRKYIQALCMRMQDKSLIVLRGSRGYIMCGYLNLKVAEKFKDTAAMITGVSTINEALKAKVFSVTSSAKKLGIYTGQPVKDALGLLV
ncbi:MAG: DUF1805 domain-containing protein [Candidatus Omnitrophota bacterium]